MVHKGIELVGTSKESFDQALENAIQDASKSLRGIKWFEVLEKSGKVENNKIVEYQIRVMIFFKVER